MKAGGDCVSHNQLAGPSGLSRLRPCAACFAVGLDFLQFFHLVILSQDLRIDLLHKLSQLLIRFLFSGQKNRKSGELACQLSLDQWDSLISPIILL